MMIDYNEKCFPGGQTQARRRRGPLRRRFRRLVQRQRHEKGELFR